MAEVGAMIIITAEEADPMLQVAEWEEIIMSPVHSIAMAEVIMAGMEIH